MSEKLSETNALTAQDCKKACDGIVTLLRQMKTVREVKSWSRRTIAREIAVDGAMVIPAVADIKLIVVSVSTLAMKLIGAKIITSGNGKKLPSKASITREVNERVDTILRFARDDFASASQVCADAYMDIYHDGNAIEISWARLWEAINTDSFIYKAAS